MPSTKNTSPNIRVPRRRRWWQRTPLENILLFHLIVILGCSKWLLPYAGEFLTAFRGHWTQVDTEFDWYAVPPSTQIIWTPCYADFECARALLPLDYLSPPGFGPNMAIAVLRLSATDRKAYKGALFVNPGGPGISATAFIAQAGKALQAIVGSGYDIIGVDSRGVGASTPRAHCFGATAQAGVPGLRGGRLLNMSDGSIELARARERITSEWCERTLGGNGREDANGTVEEWGSGRFMTSASGATDIVRIAEMLGQTKVNYWGMSYATVMGEQLVTMFPDKVERVVLDGPADAYFIRGSTWLGNLIHGPAVTEAFFSFCHQAGPEKCPIYEPTVEEIKARVRRIVERLQAEPIALPFSACGPHILRVEELQTLAFFTILYPVSKFPLMANVLFAIEQRDASALAIIPAALGDVYQCETPPPAWTTPNDVFVMSSCADGEQHVDTPEEYAAYFAALSEEAPILAPTWALHRMRCSEARLRPKWYYDGEFSTDKAPPMLLLATRFDPLCPVHHATAVQARFPGAELLLQDSYGHTTVLAAPSLCMARHLRQYFKDGSLPTNGTVCAVDELPFVGPVKTAEQTLISEEDTALLDILRKLAGAP